MKSDALPPDLDRSIEAPVKDVTDDPERWFPDATTTREVIAISAVVHVTIDALILVAIALVLVAQTRWSLP